MRGLLSQKWPNYILTALIAASILARWLWLNHIPGISGDEAWSAVQARLLLSGQPSEWSTATGRFLSPFYALPTIALQALFAPSGLVLRMPAFVSGALTALLAWPLLRRVLPETNARIAAAWIACLSLHIAMSRVAWEPSQIPLAALFVTYFALRKSLASVAIAMIAAVLVHTIDVLLLPVAAAPFAYDLWRRGKRIPKRWLIPLSCGAVLLAAWIWRSVPASSHPSMLRPIDAFKYWQGFSRIFSGVLAFGGYAAMPGSASLAVLDVVFMIGLPVLCLWRAKSIPVEYRGFAIGVLGSVLALLVVGGQAPVSIGHERHCSFLAVPCIVVLALLWPATPRGLAASYGISLALLASFWAFYFSPILKDGGDAGQAYHAGPVEPKIAASDWILADAGPLAPLQVVADNWWLYWVAYHRLMANPGRPLDMRHFQHALSKGLPGAALLGSDRDVLEFVERGGYAAGFAGGELDLALRRLEQQGHRFREADFADYAGVPFIKVWRRRL